MLSLVLPISKWNKSAELPISYYSSSSDFSFESVCKCGRYGAPKRRVWGRYRPQMTTLAVCPGMWIRATRRRRYPNIGSGAQTRRPLCSSVPSAPLYTGNLGHPYPGISEPWGSSSEIHIAAAPSTPPPSHSSGTPVSVLSSVLFSGCQVQCLGWPFLFTGLFMRGKRVFRPRNGNNRT
jgi:hypothetical protein